MKGHQSSHHILTPRSCPASTAWTATWQSPKPSPGRCHPRQGQTEGADTTGQVVCHELNTTTDPEVSGALASNACPLTG